MGGFKKNIKNIKVSKASNPTKSTYHSMTKKKKKKKIYGCFFVVGPFHDCEKRLTEEKRQERRTKKAMEPAKDLLSFELWACWQHLMNGHL